jgi:hypothetical protein
LVGLRTSRRQQGISSCSRPADHGVGHFISLGHLVVKRTIGSAAYETEAFVGLFALSTWKHRIGHWKPPSLFEAMGCRRSIPDRSLGAGAAVVRGGFDRFQQTTQVRIRPADLEGRRRPNGLFELPLVWSRNDKGL